MSHIDTRCENAGCRVRPTGPAAGSRLGTGAVRLGLLLGLLWSTTACRMNRPYAAAKVNLPVELVNLPVELVNLPVELVNLPVELVEPESGAISEEVLRELNRDPKERNSQRPNTHDKSLGDDQSSTLIRVRVVETASESVEPPAARLRIVVDAIDASDDKDDVEIEDDVEMKPGTSRVVTALPVYGSLVSTLQSIHRHQQQGKTGDDRDVSVRVAGELSDATDTAAEPVRDKPVSLATHVQELQEADKAPDLIEVAEPLAEVAKPVTEVAEPVAKAGEELPSSGPIEDPDKRQMTSITTDIRLDGKRPPNVAKDKFLPYEAATDGTCTGRGWAYSMYQWEASGLCHRPLYFEEVNLERYGYTCCPLIRPAVSAAHFFTTIPILPYKMTVQPSRECVYTLGYYRPGSLAPYQFHRMPLKPKGGLVEAAAVTGLIFAIP